MHRVADQKDALDGVEGGTSEFGEGVHGCSGALGVAFEDEAFGGVFGEGGLDFVDDLSGDFVSFFYVFPLRKKGAGHTSWVPAAEFWEKEAV